MRNILLVCILLLTFALVGCSKTEYFTGTIESITGDVANVDTTIGTTPYLIQVDLAVNDSETFAVGDSVKVGYDGQILESHPSQINTLSVEKVE